MVGEADQGSLEQFHLVVGVVSSRMPTSRSNGVMGVLINIPGGHTIIECQMRAKPEVPLHLVL
jgi:hypothetical protein